MLDECLSMGCCLSRSTPISPEERSSESGQLKQESVSRAGWSAKASVDSRAKRVVNIGTSLDRQSSPSNQSADERDDNKVPERATAGGSTVGSDDHFMNILMGGQGDGEKSLAAANRDDMSSPEPSKGGEEPPQKAMESSGGSPLVGLDPGKEASGDPQTTVADNSNSNNNNNRGQAGRQVSSGKSRASIVAERALVALPNDDRSFDEESNGTSYEEELNVNLLHQYIAIDYEITQLEDRNALRLYHEKIEQLEQLERELDMISFEAEEMAVRSEMDLSIQSDRNRMATGADSDGPILTDGRVRQQQRDDAESGSIASGLSVGSLSNKSLIRRDATQQQQQQQQQLQQQANAPNKSALAMSRIGSTARRGTVNSSGPNQKTGIELVQRGQRIEMGPKESNFSYATIEDVFNRKIILEKERDRLKKEVEMIIVECDRLQQKYKRRDEILDKLFDGRSGNGLENHLEQQLNWLMEQKHYVDQVFYAWKRAETLTGQACEQFASALELLKRLPKVTNDERRKELSENICALLIKSRQDMDKAQQYNPNVDAPFFTEAETERFDRIINAIESGSVKSSEYSQTVTVVQFAYRRAMSIRIWLESILEITIARDSFELAEEYKWIAIQLRKERISLINMKLQDPPYRQMAQTIQDQLASQQQQQQQRQQQNQLDNPNRLAITDGRSGTPTALRSGKQGAVEVNRDSGIESDDIDIEEDIYRLLEMNKSRLEAAVAASREAGTLQTTQLDAMGRPLKPPPSTPSGIRSSDSQPPGQSNEPNQGDATTTTATTSTTNTTNTITSGRRMSHHDQIMQARVQRRIRGEQPLAVRNGIGLGLWKSGQFEGAEREVASNESTPLQRNGVLSGSTSTISQTPSKLRIELDEESRRSLLEQVDSIHSKHRTKLDKLRGSNKAKANDILVRLQSSRQNQLNQAEQIGGQAD